MAIEKCWDQRIEEARQNGFFTDEDKALANSWNSCSLGESLNWGEIKTFFRKQNDDVYLLGFHHDSETFKLGLEFAAYVDQDRVRKVEPTHETLKSLVLRDGARYRVTKDSGEILFYTQEEIQKIVGIKNLKEETTNNAKV